MCEIRMDFQNRNTSSMFFQPADIFNPGAEWGRSDFDRRHRLNLAAIFQLPRGWFRVILEI